MYGSGSYQWPLSLTSIVLVQSGSSKIRVVRNRRWYYKVCSNEYRFLEWSVDFFTPLLEPYQGGWGLFTRQCSLFRYRQSIGVCHPTWSSSVVDEGFIGHFLDENFIIRSRCHPDSLVSRPSLWFLQDQYRPRLQTLHHIRETSLLWDSRLGWDLIGVLSCLPLGTVLQSKVPLFYNTNNIPHHQFSYPIPQYAWPKLTRQLGRVQWINETRS